jgi:O-antigen/teichoic acid export membrane protein
MPPHDLGRKSLLLLGSTWSGSALGMVISLLIARWLGPEGLGSIAFSTGLAGLVMAALLPGFAQAHLKRLGEGQDPGRCIGTMGSIQLALAAALALALWVAARAGWTAHATELGLVFLLLLAAQVATNFADVFLKVLLAREWVVPYALVVVLARVARLAATVAVLLWIPRIGWVAATFTIDGLLTGLGAALVLAVRYGIRPSPPTRDSLQGYWRYARPFLITTPIALFQDSIDRVLVGRWAGLTAAGYYQVARALWEALSSVLQAAGTLLFTRLSALYARRSPAGDREAREFFFGALDKLLFLGIPLALLCWALAEPLIALLYGSGFEPAALPLRILILAAAAASVINPYTFILYALEEGARFVPVNLLRVLTYLAVLAVLVPDASVGPFAGLLPGAPGGALARLFLLLFPAWVYFRWTRELAGIPLYPGARPYGLAFLAGLLMSEAMRLALPPGPQWAPPLGAMAGALAYSTVLAWLHPGTADNFRYALSLLSPRAFLAFVRRGLKET